MASIVLFLHFVMPKRPQKLRKNTRLITIDGETKPVNEWAKESGIEVPTIVKRMQRNWGALAAVFCPIEDPTFCLARKTIVAHTRKKQMDSKEADVMVSFNHWAAAMRRTGNEHGIYNHAVAIARETGELPEGL